MLVRFGDYCCWDFRRRDYGDVKGERLDDLANAETALPAVVVRVTKKT